MSDTYAIRRFYRDHPAETIQDGLTLEEAKEHCSDLQSSSKTCTTEEGCARTERLGPWFDGWTEE
jgi:hypothetical protein